MHTVSQKSERLVNLTIALLATKRYLTKSEIFRTVAGYDGDQVARDRMFERDKDDLRTLGIDIEVGSFDPIFEDEPGYRIKRDKYELQLKNLTPLKLLLLSQASQVWQEAALRDSAQLALRKLKSIGIDSDSESLSLASPALTRPPEQISEIISALNNLQRISFTYLSSDLSEKVRTVAPYRLSRSNGYWYLIAHEDDRNELRTFRVDRISSSISLSGSSDAFVIDDAALKRYANDSLRVEIAEVAILDGSSANIRSRGKFLRAEGEWQVWQLSYFDEEDLIHDVLWNGESARLLSPESAVSSLIAKLSQLVARHG